MTYRDDQGVWADRLEQLEKRIADFDAQCDEIESMRARREEWEKERAALKARIKEREDPCRVDLTNVQIAKPCKASWNDMAGDDRVRFCGSCAKNVYNVEAMSRAEAEALIQKNEGNVCLRLFRRADGTILTSDCPVGAKRSRRLKVIAAGVVTGGIAAAAWNSAHGPPVMGAIAPRTMGEISVPTAR